MSDVKADAKSIFLQALQCQAPDELHRFLDAACGGDTALRARAEELLQAHQDAGNFLGGLRPLDATRDEPLAERPGTLVGPYKLMEQIGEGGMGLVFVAEQQQPVRRKVALKVIKPGMDTRAVVARFEAERQALAMMDHPNIAKVLDAGTTETGRPYFVMDLVKGLPVTEFCDQARLTTRERLRLFVNVCHAVQHAHQKGIIHRDLKPSNVLATVQDGEALVKVIDFGIAKALGGQLTDKTVYTGFAQLLGTPLYMSPEQAALSNVDVDTRSDIYSLGVLLYELLTGTTPFDGERLRTLGYDEIRRIIREEEPPRPSTRLSTLGQAAATASTNRKCQPGQLSRLIRGELDWIVMKCLEKDRNRRYETANGLAMDVKRYLADEPVQACPPSAGYRLRKFARRHKGKLTAAAALLAVVLAGGAVSAWQAVRATRAEGQTRTALGQVTAEQARTQEALDAAGEALDTLTDDVVQTMFARQAQLDETEKAFLRRVIEQHEAIARQEGETPKAQFIRAKGQYQVAYLREKLGEQHEALAGYQQAAGMLGQLAEQFPDEALYRHKLARAEGNLGILLARLGKQPEAETAIRRGIELRTKLTADFPDNLDYLKELAGNVNDLGALRELQHNYAEAEEHYRRCLDLMETLVTRAGDQPRYRLQQAQLRSNLGQLLRKEEKYAESEQVHRQALEVEEQLLGKGPPKPKDRQWLANSYTGLALALVSQKKMPEAETAFRQALETRRKLTDDYPGVIEYLRELANGTSDFAYFLAMQKKYAAAEEPYRHALEMRKTVLQKAGPVPGYRHQLARDYYYLAHVHNLTDRPKEAEAEWQAALDLWRQLVIDVPKAPDFANGLGSTLTSLAELHNKRGEFAAAVDLLTEARKHLRAALDARPKDREFRDAHHDYLLALGKGRLGLADHVQAAATADELTRFGFEPAADNYEAASLLGGCAMLAAKDAKLAEVRRKELSQTYADRAVVLLGQAAERGFKDATRLKADANLEPLRNRPEFKKLLAQMGQKK
jgi:serine/threonine protein kinase/tetratricopeptide (TPR) repeat protein